MAGAGDRHRAYLIETLRRDPWRMDVLRTVRALGLPDWAVGAGFVRAGVWDRRFGKARPTPLGDVDVIYFDPAETGRKREAAVEAGLAARRPDVPWSVRNQARMHLRNGDPAYDDTCQAIAFWLETATCVAVRLEPDDTLTVLAPHGLDDLMEGLVRATPAGRRKRADFEKRLAEKNWPGRWPRLRVVRD